MIIECETLRNIQVIFVIVVYVALIALSIKTEISFRNAKRKTKDLEDESLKMKNKLNAIKKDMEV